MFSSRLLQFSVTLAAIACVSAQGPIQFVATYQSWGDFERCPQDVAPTQGSVVEGECTDIDGYTFKFNPSAAGNVGCTVQFFTSTGCGGLTDTVNVQSNEQSSCILPIYSFKPPAIGEVEGGAQSVIVTCEA